MLDGVAVLDTEKCSQCQACVDACPQGAITAVGVPAVTAKTALFQPEPETKVVVAEPVSVIEKPWLAAALAFAGQEIFPRFAEALVSALERRLSRSQPVQTFDSRLTSNPAPLSDGKMGNRNQRNFRPGHGRRHHGGRWHGRGLGRGKWL